MPYSSSNCTKYIIQVSIWVGKTNQFISYFSNKENICCWYSKELSQWGGSFEHQKQKRKPKGKQILIVKYWSSKPYYSHSKLLSTLFPLFHLVCKGLVRDIWSFCHICLTCCLILSSLPLGQSRGGGGGGSLSKSVFETKTSSSHKFSDGNFPISELESLQKPIKTSSVLNFTSLDLIFWNFRCLGELIKLMSSELFE